MLNPTAGIPIRNYFDPEIYQVELDLLFRNRVNYLSAAGRIKNEYDYYVVERLQDSKILTRNKGQLQLIDNICAHRQAKMLSGFGNSRYLTCPFHRWSYEHDGRCVHSPLYRDGKGGLRLGKGELVEWKGLLFEGPSQPGRIFEDFHLLEAMQIDRMVYRRTVREEVNYNWKHYIDVFGENYHIPFIHPGFCAFLDLPSMQWVEHDEYHAQLIRPRRSELLRSNSTTPVYRKWIDGLLQFFKGDIPEYAGILLMCYPNLMIECYPLYMLITTIHPTGPESSVLYSDYFHHQDIAEARPDLVAAAEAACEETMLEDADLCNRIAMGRRLLYQQGREAEGPYQRPYEEGMAMFHQFYRKAMEPVASPGLAHSTEINAFSRPKAVRA